MFAFVLASELIGGRRQGANYLVNQLLGCADLGVKIESSHIKSSIFKVEVRGCFIRMRR